jgi:hypothetical protein
MLSASSEHQGGSKIRNDELASIEGLLLEITDLLE